MNKRIEKLCELCREVDKAQKDSGVISISSPVSGEVHLTEGAFFKYFDEYKEEDFSEMNKCFYRNVDGIKFFCLVGKGENNDK